MLRNKTNTSVLLAGTNCPLHPPKATKTNVFENFIHSYFELIISVKG